MARVPCNPEDRRPTLAYYCEGDGEPIAVEPLTIDGVPVVQAPLHFCGTGEAVCEDSTVAACPSDTDGNPTSYGPLPIAPNPSDVTGRSPRISRLRVNRTGLAALPYASSKRPDQLIDIVSNDGTPVPWDASTGRFTLPAGVSLKTYSHVVKTGNEALAEFFPDFQHNSPTQVVTNPSASLDMWVDVIATIQLGFTLAADAKVFIQPYITADGVSYSAVWGEQQPKLSEAVSYGRTITFGTGLNLVPGASCTIGIGVVLQEQEGDVTAAGPLSMFFKAVGMNHD